jgi:hypothetical protein
LSNVLTLSFVFVRIALFTLKKQHEYQDQGGFFLDKKGQTEWNNESEKLENTKLLLR